MTTPLLKPTIQIFLYDLQEGLGQSEEQIKKNRRNFWRRINDEISDKDLNEYAKKERAESTKLVPLYGTEKRKFPKNSDIDGGFFAFQLGDTYILWIDCSVKENEQQPLTRIQELITEHFTISEKKFPDNDSITEPTLGKSWLILGQLPPNCPKDKIEQIEQIAKDSYTKIQKNAPNWENDKVETEQPNQLLGGYLFECFRPQEKWLPLDEKEAQQEQENLTNNQQLHLLQNYHHIIWLFPNDIPETEIAKIKVYLIKLFCHRHKILLAYYQSRRLKNELKKSYTETKQIVATFTQDKNQPQKQQINLTQTLDILAKYAVRLNELFSQKRTLEINLENYNKQIEKLQKKDPQSRLESFQNFSQRAQNKYLKQIESEYTHFSTGLTLLENLIKTIEGLNQIEQTRTEQNLTQTIGITGLGLAASGITATLISTQIPTPQPNSKEAYTLPFSFILSFAILLPFALAVFWRLRRR